MLIVSKLCAQTVFPVKINGKFGLINRTGLQVLPAEYDAISPFNNFGVATTLKGNKIGLLAADGTVILGNEYTKIEVIDSAAYLVKKFDYKAIFYKNKIIYKGVFDSVRLVKNEAKRYFKVNDKLRLTVLYDDGKLLFESIDAQRVKVLNDDYAIVTNRERKGLFYKEKQVIRCNFDDISPIGYNHFRVQNGDVAGVMDNHGTTILGVTYQRIEPLEIVTKNVYFKVGDYRGYYVFNNKYSKLSKEKYDNVVAERFATLQTYKDGLNGLLDSMLNVIFEPIHTDIKVLSFLNAKIEKNSKWILHNFKTKNQSKLDYDQITSPEAFFFTCRINTLWGLLDESGQQVLPCAYSKIEIDEENNTLKVWKGEQMSIIEYDEKGKLNLDEKTDFAGYSTLNVGKTVLLRSNDKLFANRQLNIDTEGDYEWFQNNKQKWGIRNQKTKKIRLKPQFDDINILPQYGFTIVSNEVEILLEIDRTHFKFLKVYGIVNNKRGLPVVPTSLLNIKLTDFEKGNPSARVVFTNGKHGLLKKNGKILKKDCAYIGDFVNGLARISMKGSLESNLNAGNMSLQTVFSYLNSFGNPFMMTDYTQYDERVFRNGQLVCKECSFGVIDTLGNLKIEAKYSHIEDLKHDVFITNQNGKYGLLDKNGATVTPFDFDEIKPLSDKTKLFKTAVFAQKYGLMDQNGQLLFNTEYDNIADFRDDVLPFERNKRWGLLDKTGNEILFPTYQKIETFSEQKAACKTTKGWGFLDVAGANIVPCTYLRVSAFQENVAMAATPKGTGFIDDKNKFVIKPEYYSATAFKNGMSMVMDKGELFCIDHKGKKINNPTENDEYKTKLFFAKNSFSNTYTYNNSVGLTHECGVPLTTAKYNNIVELPSGYLKVRLKQHEGIITNEGKEIGKPIFDHILAAGQELFRLESGNKIGYIDATGDWIWSLKE